MRTAVRHGAAASTVPILELQGLTKIFGGIRAIDGLDLAIAAGELHCIVGPNGAGKSTLFKLLMGIERPTSGRLLYCGAEVNRVKTFQRARRGIALKFQDIRVFHDLTVFQNLFIPLRRHYAAKQIPDQVHGLLRQLNMTSMENTQVRSLSHGQQQWLAIGMSLAARPELLLLDEPTAGMSSEESQMTGEIVRALNRAGTAIIVIEHDMAFIRGLDSRTTVLHYGKLFAQGSFAEIESNEDVRRIYLGTV